MVSGSAFAASFGWVGTAIGSDWGRCCLCCGAVFIPIGALIAAVAIIIAVCFVLWKYCDRFSSFVKGFARGIAHAFGRAFEAAIRFFDADTINKWKNIIANAFDFSQVWQKFKQGIGTIAQSFANL